MTETHGDGNSRAHQAGVVAARLGALLEMISPERVETHLRETMAHAASDPEPLACERVRDSFRVCVRAVREAGMQARRRVHELREEEAAR